MTTQKKLSPLDLFNLCYNLLSTKKNVTKGCAARDYRGQPCLATEFNAACWCSAGAITLFVQNRHPLTYAQAKFVLESALDAAAMTLDPRMRPKVHAYITFHDTHSYADTLAMWHAAKLLIQSRPDKGLV